MVPEKHKITLVFVELLILSGAVWLVFSGLITPLMLIGGLMLARSVQTSFSRKQLTILIFGER